MKTVLLGTDFMYNQEGNLVPIQINTAVSQNNIDRVEDEDYIFDLTQLKELIVKNKFETIFYLGNIISFKNRLLDLCTELGITLMFYRLSPPSLTVPLIKDNEFVLIIRSAYDTSAIIDDSYCRNRAEFLNLIKDTDFGTEFAYINYEGTLVNNIKTIPDNNGLPNFIIKSTYPDFEPSLYPKLYCLKTYGELEILIENLSPSFFCTPFYYNPDKLYDNRIKNIRSLNLLTSPDLVSMPIGAYTKITKDEISDEKTKSVIINNRTHFITTNSVNEINDDKIYLKEKIIQDNEIIIMNDILTKIGKQIIIENS